jgi:GH25 family lysozyme M1 (1,4-beta-N-acetylmuramidase)
MTAGAAAPAHAGTLPKGGTGLHDGMMPAKSPDARVTAGASATPHAATATVPSTGVDVSSHQHPSASTIDWGQVAASGQRFAVVKATEYYSDTNGPVLYTNPYVKPDIQRAHAAGLVVGAYDFAHPENSAITQADQFSAAIGTLPDGSLPPVLDLETDGGLSPAQLVSWTQTYLDRLQRDTGILPMIYTSPYFWNQYLGGSSSFTRYPLWEANYTADPTPQAFGGWSTYDIWQFTDSAAVPGISGKVDQDRFDGTALNSLAHRQPVALPAPASLSPGASLVSANLQYRLDLQSDGDLVQYGNGRALWSAGTSGNPGARLDVQRDGNLVLYSSSGSALWNTRTWGAGSDGRLSLQDDGNLVLYVGGRAVWNNGALGSDTLAQGVTLMSNQYLHSPSFAYRFVLQNDGNAVVYDSAQRALWSSRTWGQSGACLTLQPDGNLVVYKANGQAAWNAATWGISNERLVMQNDGNLVIYAATGRALWSSRFGRAY